MTTTATVISVPAPGTPVPLTTDKTITAHRIVVSQSPASAGIVYLKVATTGAVMRAFVKPASSGLIDEHVIEGNDTENPLRPADYAVDAATAGDGVYAYWQVE